MDVMALLILILINVVAFFKYKKDKYEAVYTEFLAVLKVTL